MTKCLFFPEVMHVGVKHMISLSMCSIHIMQPHLSNRNSRRKCESAVRMLSPVTESCGAPSQNTFLTGKRKQERF